MRHWRYFKYVVRHKWYVMLACFRRCLYWQGIVHDWSKFLPDEWIPYANWFYGDQGVRFNGGFAWEFRENELQRIAFNYAWLKHQHRNPHHWQHWILREDSGKELLMDMPKKYRLEMLCDWEGAGMAITGKCEYELWYLKNNAKIQLHPTTKAHVLSELGLEGVLMKTDDLPTYQSQ